jgi:hypothetical protein
MVEKVNTSLERRLFDETKMGHLEAAKYKAWKEGRFVDVFQANLEMYKEQWKLPDSVAATAVHFSRAADTFLNDRDSDVKEVGYSLIYSYYHLIARYSPLSFDPQIATQLHLRTAENISPKRLIPIKEMTELFGYLYSIPSNDETLYDAMELRDTAFIIFSHDTFGKSDEDWKSFEGYLTDYYRYLKMAARNS